MKPLNCLNVQSRVAQVIKKALPHSRRVRVDVLLPTYANGRAQRERCASNSVLRCLCCTHLINNICSALYVKKKEEFFSSLGLALHVERLQLHGADGVHRLREWIDNVNHNDEVSGAFVQLPMIVRTFIRLL